MAIDLNNLANILRTKGQLDEAEKLLRESLAIDRKLLGNEHPVVALELNNLAVVLQAKGQLDEAERLYREALAMNRKLLETNTHKWPIHSTTWQRCSFLRATSRLRLPAERSSCHSP